MALIERFDIKKNLYDKILENPQLLENIHIFLNPLFSKKPNKIYNINKAFTFQTVIKNGQEEEDEQLEEINEEYEEEIKTKKKRERLEKCNRIISIIMENALPKERITLAELLDLTDDNEALKREFVPTVEIFKEVLVEMIKARNIDISELRQEKKTFIDSGEIEFQLNNSILDIIDENIEFKNIKYISINKIERNSEVKIKNVIDENGNYKNLICSDLLFEVKEK